MDYDRSIKAWGGAPDPPESALCACDVDLRKPGVAKAFPVRGWTRVAVQAVWVSGDWDGSSGGGADDGTVQLYRSVNGRDYLAADNVGSLAYNARTCGNIDPRGCAYIVAVVTDGSKQSSEAVVSLYCSGDRAQVLGSDTTAPVDASYLVLGLNGDLTAERVLTAGIGVSFVDGGAGGNLTINAGTGVYAPIGASFVTIGSNGSLTDERVLTAGAGIGITDGGANSTVTIAVTDAELAALMVLTSAADKVPYFTGPGTAALADFSSFGRSLVDDANAAAGRTTLGLGTVSTLASDTDGTLAANSDGLVPTQKAVKTYVDNAVTGLLEFKGSTDASANPNYPAANKGDAYYITVAGKIGGGSGKSVDVGDVYVASADNAGGTEASVGTSWFVLEHNLVGALLAANNLSDITNASTARSNLGLAIGTNVQAWDVDLDALAALAATGGMLARTGAGAFAVRTITGSTHITLTHGDGVAGAPTITIGNAVMIKGSGRLLGVLRPGNASPPATLYAQLDVYAGGPTPAENWECIAFDAAVDEYMDFSWRIPEDYNGGGLTLKCVYLARSSTSTGTQAYIGAAIRRCNLSSEDLDTSQTYDYNFGAAAPSGTLGQIKELSIAFTSGADMDSAAAGEEVNIRIRRNGTGSVSTDDMAGDWLLRAIAIYET